MDKEQAVQLGKLIRERRQAMGMSTHELGKRIGARNSTITRLEQGAFAAPSPEKLAGIAEALGISLADMYSQAGYMVPGELPGFHAYLPARYRDLPETSLQELMDLFDTLVARHRHSDQPQGSQSADEELVSEGST